LFFPIFGIPKNESVDKTVLFRQPTKNQGFVIFLDFPFPKLILKKIKIALDLKAEDILDILVLADLKVSKYELSAFFRKPEHRHYRPLRDQILRNFLKGMQIKYRDNVSGSDPESTEQHESR